jgi:hypothetical protein
MKRKMVIFEASSKKIQPFMQNKTVFQPGQKLQHLKTGGLYQIICQANIEATLEEVYVYQALSNHSHWVRPASEMLDGRFIAIE